MKTKFKNKLRYIAAGIFMMGLVANVSLSLTDPFVYMGIDLLAQTGSNRVLPDNALGAITLMMWIVKQSGWGMCLTSFMAQVIRVTDSV